MKVVSDPVIADAILAAISELSLEDLQRLGGWGPLEEISAATVFDGIEGSPAGVFQSDDNTFEVSCTVYVILQYGGRRDGVAVSDSYPAIVRAVLKRGKPEIVSIAVDNRSFYE